MGLVNISKLPEIQIAPGISVKVISTKKLTVFHANISAGAVLPNHSHHNEQIINVINGELQLEVKGKIYTLGPGNSFVLSPNVPHAGRAISECTVIDVFYPAREDFRDGSFKGYIDSKKS